MDLQRKILTLLVILLTCLSCAAPKAVQDSLRDSCVLVIRDSVILRDSVVLVEIPRESDKSVVFAADTSILETSVARSVAFITSDGHLSHSLSNKAALLPVKITIPEKAHSEQRVHTVVDRQYIEVEKELSRWQNFLITLGYCVLAAVAVWLVIKARRILP